MIHLNEPPIHLKKYVYKAFGMYAAVLVVGGLIFSLVLKTGFGLDGLAVLFANQIVYAQFVKEQGREFLDDERKRFRLEFLKLDAVLLSVLMLGFVFSGVFDSASVVARVGIWLALFAFTLGFHWLVMAGWYRYGARKYAKSILDKLPKV
jgi:hypothetical protein